MSTPSSALPASRPSRARTLLALLGAGLLLSACGPDLASLKHVRATLQPEGLVLEELGEPDAFGQRWPQRVTLASLEGTLDGAALVATSLGRVRSEKSCSSTFATVCSTADVYTPPTLAFPAALPADAAPHTLTVKTQTGSWVLVTPDFGAQPMLKLVAPASTTLKDGDHVTVDCGAGGTVKELTFVSGDSLTVKLVSDNVTPGPVSVDLALAGRPELRGVSGQALAGRLTCLWGAAFTRCEGPAECAASMGNTRLASTPVTLQVP